MAKIGFGSEFKTKSAFDVPKLSLIQNEKARVCIIDDPETEYVHTLREVILENGKPNMVESTFRGRVRQEPEKEFKGKYICLGDPEVLAKKKVDPDNCPACKASVENSNAVEGPKPRYVVSVLKYGVKKGSFTPVEPFQVELLAWEFAESRFNALCDIRDEHGNLNGVDLILGPCENAGFQKFSISTGGTCVWASDPKKKATSIETIKNQKQDDLSPLLGRKVSSSDLAGEVRSIVNTWNTAFGVEGDMPSESSTPDASFGSDIGALLGGSDSSTGQSSSASEPESSVEVSADEEKKEGSDVEDLNALLSNFK